MEWKRKGRGKDEERKRKERGRKEERKRKRKGKEEGRKSQRKGRGKGEEWKRKGRGKYEERGKEEECDPRHRLPLLKSPCAGYAQAISFRPMFKSTRLS